MSERVYIDGTVYAREQARVSVFDRGFLYGDSVYEVIRTAGGNPVDLEPHLDRLARSAEAIAITLPESETIRGAISKTLQSAGNTDSYIRVVVTRGESPIGLEIVQAETSSLIVMVKPLSLPPQRIYEEGALLSIVDVQTTPKRAMDPSIKSGNYLTNIMALRQAKQRGAYEAIRLNSAGHVAEGASSNLFAVVDGGLITPSPEEGLLVGITRTRVIALAESRGVTVTEASMTPSELLAADEVFITSSVRGIVPARGIDDVAFSPVPGPITTRLMAAYGQFLQEVANNGT